MHLVPALNFLAKGRQIDRVRILDDYIEFDATNVSLTEPLTQLRSLRVCRDALPSFMEFTPSLARLQLDEVNSVSDLTLRAKDLTIQTSYLI